MLLMVVYAEGVEVLIGQSINYKKYPNIVFIFDILTNVPSVSMMIVPEFFKLYGCEVVSLIFNGSLFIITPFILSVAYLEAYRQYNIFYNMTIMLFLVLPQCLR